MNIIWLLMFHNISLSEFETNEELKESLSDKVKSILAEKPKIEYFDQKPEPYKMTFNFLSKMNFILSNSMEQKTLEMLKNRFEISIENLKRPNEQCQITLGPMKIIC